MAHDVVKLPMIEAEINANNRKVQELADEKGMKVAQNVEPASPDWWCGRCGSPWISKAQPTRMWSRCKPANNI